MIHTHLYVQITGRKLRFLVEKFKMASWGMWRIVSRSANGMMLIREREEIYPGRKGWREGERVWRGRKLQHSPETQPFSPFKPRRRLLPSSPDEILALDTTLSSLTRLTPPTCKISSFKMMSRLTLFLVRLVTFWTVSCTFFAAQSKLEMTNMSHFAHI